MWFPRSPPIPNRHRANSRSPRKAVSHPPTSGNATSRAGILPAPQANVLPSKLHTTEQLCSMRLRCTGQVAEPGRCRNFVSSARHSPCFQKSPVLTFTNTHTHTHMADRHPALQIPNLFANMGTRRRVYPYLGTLPLHSQPYRCTASSFTRHTCIT